jgi:hypothetical protein
MAQCGGSLFELVTRYYLDDSIKEGEMGRECGRHSGEEKFVHFGGQVCKKRDGLEYLDIDGRIILKWS